MPDDDAQSAEAVQRQEEEPPSFLSSVYDAPATRLHEIYLALRRAGFTKGQSESYVAELVADEFRQALI